MSKSNSLPLDSQQIQIKIGVEKATGKWVAELRFPDGTVRSTDKRYDTRDELETDIKQWLDANGIEHVRFN